MLLRFAQPPVARSANRGRVVPFGNKYGGRRRSSLLGMHEEDLLRSHSVRSNKKGNNRLTFASLRSACPLLDRRIGAAFSLRSKYGGRRRSSLLGMHEIQNMRFRSAQSSGT